MWPGQNLAKRSCTEATSRRFPFLNVTSLTLTTRLDLIKNTGIQLKLHNVTLRECSSGSVRPLPRRRGRLHKDTEIRPNIWGWLTAGWGGGGCMCWEKADWSPSEVSHLSGSVLRPTLQCQQIRRNLLKQQSSSETPRSPRHVLHKDIRHLLQVTIYKLPLIMWHN